MMSLRKKPQGYDTTFYGYCYLRSGTIKYTITDRITLFNVLRRFILLISIIQNRYFQSGVCPARTGYICNYSVDAFAVIRLTQLECLAFYICTFRFAFYELESGSHQIRTCTDSPFREHFNALYINFIP